MLFEEGLGFTRYEINCESEIHYSVDLSLWEFEFHFTTSRYPLLDEFTDCQFGRGEQKPTDIWTNDNKLGRILEAMGGKCNCPRPHEESVRADRGGARSKNFAALPINLCYVISEYVKSKHSQLRFEDILQCDRQCRIHTWLKNITSECPEEVSLNKCRQRLQLSICGHIAVSGEIFSPQ